MYALQAGCERLRGDGRQHTANATASGELGRGRPQPGRVTWDGICPVLAAVAPTRRRRAHGRGIGRRRHGRVSMPVGVTESDENNSRSCPGVHTGQGRCCPGSRFRRYRDAPRILRRVAGDHYIQAALMGRWGEPPAKAPRERSIAVRMKKPPKTFLTTPENVGKENNLYPPWVEKLWQLYTPAPIVQLAATRSFIASEPRVRLWGAPQSWQSWLCESAARGRIRGPGLRRCRGQRFALRSGLVAFVGQA